MLVVDQYLNERVLRKHLNAHGVHVEQGVEPASLQQEPDGVSVTLKKTGPDGETFETFRASYVIGADGGSDKNWTLL